MCDYAAIVRRAHQLKRCSMCETFCLFAVTKNDWQSLCVHKWATKNEEQKWKWEAKCIFMLCNVCVLCVCFSVSLIISAVFVIVIAIGRRCLFCCHLSQFFLFVRSLFLWFGCKLLVYYCCVLAADAVGVVTFALFFNFHRFGWGAAEPERTHSGVCVCL